MRRFNKVIAILTASDVFTWGLTYALTGITGLFLLTKIDTSEDQVVRIVGIGASIVSLTRGLLQIPVGILVDKIKSDKDDIAILTLGNFLMGAPILLYGIITTETFFYVLQIFIGIGCSLNLVTWRKMFAKNLDKGKEGLEYASYDAIMSIAIAIFSAMVGIISSLGTEYFEMVIMAIGILITSSSIWPILLYRVKGRNLE